MMNLVVPMAGKGSRFLKEGVKTPKPFILVEGKTILQRSLERIPRSLVSKYFFIGWHDHIKYYTSTSFPYERDGYIKILTEENSGQTETCLSIAKLINNEEPLFILNSDNVLYFDILKLEEEILFNAKVDGAVFVVNDFSEYDHFCFAKVNQNNQIEYLAEKNRISDVALCGGFFWKRGSDFVKYATEQVEKQKKSKNGEYYLGPVYNLAIEKGLNIVPFFCDKMISLGTPEELNNFKKSND